MSFLHVYTGKGKGKTTAALGLIMRAYGAGLRVFFAQFLKKGDYSEIDALKSFCKGVTVRQYGSGSFVNGKPSFADREAVAQGMEEVASVLRKQNYDLVVLDEANVAITYELINIDDFIEMLKKRNERIEVVVTGRDAHEKLIEMADLVTEMQEVKHYYVKGVQARKGIEK